ncbi:MAG: gamma-glutamylcyclotransferase family protein [Opitutaceae bacterium]
MNRLFVYGTLKRGCRSHHHLARHRFVAEAVTGPGFRLYRLDGYPGLVKDATATQGITGELWEVDDAGLAELDAFEGLAEGLYRRELVALFTPPGFGEAFAYVYARGVTGRPEIGPSWVDTH